MAASEHKDRRAITAEEHARIIAREGNCDTAPITNCFGIWAVRKRHRPFNGEDID